MPSARRQAAVDSGGGGAAYYKNCSAAKAAGAAPLLRGRPGYRAALDRDGDGVACET
ncbi:excalibur calcium-binding domain-containing protein [Pseudonocardia benzenivorans]|uniref:Excalibur calcium-binding domain-containing protein n=1 Tax=Pseudonocardia benzenivorans TaxID=228005 RepID=A0ABW3VEC4_9PSEU